MIHIKTGALSTGFFVGGFCAISFVWNYIDHAIFRNDDADIDSILFFHDIVVHGIITGASSNVTRDGYFTV